MDFVLYLYNTNYQETVGLIFYLTYLEVKAPFYISKNADGNYCGTKESRYDDFLHKLKINSNFIRVISFVLSIIWFFYFK